MQFGRLTGLLFMLVAVDAEALVVEFDIPSSETIFTSATVEGFIFTSEHFHLVGDGYWASNGTTHLVYETGRGHPITMSMVDVGTFSLLGFDGAEGGTIGHPDRPPAEAIGLLGYRPDGSTVSAEFRFDGMHDGGLRGTANDFQPFALPGRFTGLNAVLFYGIRSDGRDGGVAMDNLHIIPGTSVPEPAGLVLLGFGLAGLGLGRSRIPPTSRCNDYMSPRPSWSALQQSARHT